MIVKPQRSIINDTIGKKRSGQDHEAFRLLARIMARHHIVRSSTHGNFNDQVTHQVRNQKRPAKKAQKPDKEEKHWHAGDRNK